MRTRLDAIIRSSLALCIFISSNVIAQVMGQPVESEILTLAAKQIQQGQYNLAIESYTQAIALNKNDTLAHVYRGWTYESLGKHDLAMADCNMAIQLDPTFAAAYDNRGWIYEDQGKYVAAIADFTAAIKLDAKRADAYNNRGWSYESLGKHDLAMADCNMAIQLDPTFAAAYGNRGWIYEDLGKYVAAIADFTAAIKLDAKRADAYNNRGWSYESLGKHDLAMADCNMAIQLDPTFAAAYGNRGRIYEDLGKYDQAIADCSIAIKLDPKLADAYNSRGWSYECLGKHDLAIADLNAAIKLNPTVASSYRNRGSAFCERGNYTTAIKEYTTAIKIDPTDACSYEQRGWIYEHLDKHQQAIADCSAGIKLDPSNAETYKTRGQAYEHLTEHRLAITDYTSAIQLNPSDGLSYLYRFASDTMLGDAAHAEADFRTAFSLLSQASISGNEKLCTVPFECHDNLIYVPVKIGRGKSTYCFLLDTGSESVIISNALARKLHIHTLPYAIKNVDAVGATGTEHLCLPDAITLGACLVQHPFGVVSDLRTHEQSTGVKIDGILGMSFLSHYRLTIDYAKQQLTLSQATDPLQGTYLFHAVDPQPLSLLAIPALIDGRATNLIPDTGSSCSSLPDTQITQLAYPKQAMVSCLGSMSFGIHGRSASDYLVRLKDLQVGDVHLRDYPVENIDNDMGVLGAEYLSQFQVTFDYPDKMVMFTPVTDAKFENNVLTYGICYSVPKHKRLRLNGVWENSPAAKAGLHAGDCILKIDNKQVTQAVCADLDNNDNDSTPSNVTLLIRSHGKQRTVTLTQADLFPPISPTTAPPAGQGAH